MSNEINQYEAYTNTAFIQKPFIVIALSVWSTLLFFVFFFVFGCVSAVINAI